jgi:class 3 adenylate cyclase/tetratricopeptide (TPR) repeat protein
MLCPRCGTENPERAKFCNECAAPLAPPATDAGTERKVVSVLFCDLVGFTSRSEHTDPEDVLAMVRPYHSLLRTEIEAFGGTVEKFIGDAVMAVFGAPLAHEDDAERAVRAGLRILESLEEMNEELGSDLAVRIGINTGEAVVSQGANPERGEGIVTGDVVNTAARIQTGAPPGGVAVGETTYLATKDIFDYGELEPIAAKGKAEPVAAWRALAARGRFGTDLTRRHDTPLVGREAERTLLRTVFDRAARDRSCQLVTILGEPGVGKSRMVSELFTYIDQERPELITWRQGRSLPYGDGITFWALGEIVKAHAGILESDDLEEVTDKLETALRTASLEPSEHEWLRARVGPLVGIEAAGTAEQEESFTAWRRFLEAVAGVDPVVYVFEDLHWADPAMLAFIEHLADWSEGVPMLLVGTARPELAETHPGFGAGLRNATTMNLTPLSEEETARLIGELLGQAVLPAEVQAPILERAGGNPLYAEEFVRMLKDRCLLVERGRTWELTAGAEIPFPEGVQGLIAARLDTLAPDRKSLLHDAAVIGKVFWAGALAAMGGRDDKEVRDALHELSRKEFVRARRQGSVEGEQEFGFWHMLVRDVAYAQIPRAARAAKHVAAAEWIEARSGGRAEDLADVLAHHYVEALDLTEATGGDTAGLAERALRFLVLAGDRAAGLDAARAQATYERALELAPAGHPRRAEIEYELGRVLNQRSEYVRAAELLTRSREAFLAAGEPARAAQVALSLGRARWAIAPSREAAELTHDAIRELEQLPPGPELVNALWVAGSWQIAEGSIAAALQSAERSLSIARQLDLPVEVGALRVRGSARCFSGDLGGLEDLRSAIDLALERGLLPDAAHCSNDLSLALSATEGPAVAIAALQDGIELARRSGNSDIATFMASGTMLELLYDAGRWDELLTGADTALREDSDADAESLLLARVMVCDVAIWRDELAYAGDVLRGVADEVIEAEDPQFMVMGLDVAAHLALALGDLDRSNELLRRVADHPSIRESWNYVAYLPEVVRVAIAAGDTELATRLADDVSPTRLQQTRVGLCMADAELAEARGDLEPATELYASAEEGWRTFSVPELGQALLGRGRCFVALGDPAAQRFLREARSVFASLSAERFLPEVDTLLERSMRLSS